MRWAENSDGGADRLVRYLIGCALVAISACGPHSAGNNQVAQPRSTCSDQQYWSGGACVARHGAGVLLQQAAVELAAFKVPETLALLDKAAALGPHSRETAIDLQEKLGIAHAYAGDESAALEAFDELLLLEPGHLLSYTLSPRVTFLFERARKSKTKPQPPAVDLSWPRSLRVQKSLPIDIEVVTDARHELARAELQMRRKGSTSYRSVDVTLPKVGSFQRVVLPPIRSSHNEVLELYLRAYDKDGNERLRWGSAERPREIALGYTKPVSWYRKWWVWAIAGSVVATGTGVSVYAIQRKPSDTVDGGLDINR